VAMYVAVVVVSRK